jgi:hypothetical protein
MNKAVFHVRRSVATLLLVAQGVAPVSALAAAAAAPVAAQRPAAAAPAAKHLPIVVQRALGLYQQARYDEAVTLLIGPVSRGELKGTDLREARIVLARCYVKKGLDARAKENFTAILAAEPTFVLDASKADAEEITAFRQAMPASAASGPIAMSTPVGPAPAPAPPPAAPKPKTPAMRAALPPSSGVTKKGWLSSHKGVAVLVAVAGGGAIAALASGGGGSTTAPPATPTVPDFPPPPTP